MNDLELGKSALTALEKQGFEKSQVRVTSVHFDEMQADFSEPNLLRSFDTTKLSLDGVHEEKKANLGVSQTEPEALRAAAAQLWDLASVAKPDPANDVADWQPSQRFDRGPRAREREQMLGRLVEFLEETKRLFPSVMLRTATVTFSRRCETLLNSNGVQLESEAGSYGVGVIFAAREGHAVSSFNFTGLVLADLEKPLMQSGTVCETLRQVTEQLAPRRVPQRFNGDIVIAPDCLDSFLGFLTSRIGNYPMISGTSVYKEKLGQLVASPQLNLHSRPLDLPGGYCITHDGFAAENATLVAEGRLQSFLLDQFGSRKTERARARTGGGCQVVDAGSTPRSELIGGVGRGILVGRFSGGVPSDRGDFSGIAKNSYYIEDGQVQYPVSEVMLSGNMVDLLENIIAVSQERADFGNRIYPWIRVSGIGVS